MSATSDRAQLLRGQSTVNGIDFIEIGTPQTEILVHFFNPITVGDLTNTVVGATITGGDAIPTVAVQSIAPADWSAPTGNILTLHALAPGDFSLYTLELVTNPPRAPHALDPYFDHVEFSFKAGCHSTLDCDPPPEACPKDAPPAPPIDYLAKDFESFRAALLEMSAIRNPAWQERSEADFGVMFLEALSSVADDLSYFQDRIAAEAHLGTATERRSLVRLARLVDYEPRPATAARILLQLDVTGDHIPAGTKVTALGPDGASIDFMIGTGLADQTSYAVNQSRNRVLPYWWDPRDECLHSGATEMWLTGHGLGLLAGQKLLIDTAPLVGGDPSVRELVTLVADGDEQIDPLYNDAPVTRIIWRAEDALAHDHDLTRTTVAGNLLLATQGRVVQETFGIASAPSGGLPAIVRTGPNGTAQFLYTLQQSPLAWLPLDDDPEGPPWPEIRLSGSDSILWAWRRSLLDAGEFDEAFTVDPVRYRPVGPAPSGGMIGMEYDGRDGDTLRFGDGSFGLVPADGMTFQVTYLVGGGASGNVAAGTTFSADPAAPISRVTCPFAATGGQDPESDEDVRRRAPHAYKSGIRRAVVPRDYETLARMLSWVQRANTSYRYTGSWLEVFTAADPRGAEQLTLSQRIELFELLDRVRLAGYDSHVLTPRFAALDIVVEVCARIDAFRADVRGAILDALSARVLPDGSKGYFHVDHFTFGQPLMKRSLEAAVQRVAGVDGVRSVRYRRRGGTTAFQPMPSVVTVGVGEIIQVDSNPSRAERGSVLVSVEGGK